MPVGEDDDTDAYYSNVTDNDPIEPVNRAIFTFNDFVDMILIEPVARAYHAVLPDPVEDGVHNVLSNLTAPVVLVNAALQGDVEHAFVTLWRFILNSTFGLAGIFDFAEANTGLMHRSEDFGQTLGVYGVGAGPYIVLPLLGPSSVRDVVGTVFDTVIDPVNYAKPAVVYTRTGLTVIDSRVKALPVTDDIDANALDPYSAFRSAYWQYRENLITNGGK